MSREELLRLFVLDSMADDYEAVPEIMRGVGALAAECGIEISRDEVVTSLRALIEAGLVRAWSVGHRNQLREEAFVPPVAEADRYYYLPTEAGRDIHTEFAALWGTGRIPPSNPAQSPQQ